MKQILQSYKSGEIWLAEVPVPALKDNGVLVKTETSLISAGTERQMTQLAKKSLVGKAKDRPDLVQRVIQKVKSEGLINTASQVLNKLDTPVPLGYSCAGRVIKVGANVDTIKVGDRVACAGAGYASHSEYNYIPKNLCAKIPTEFQAIISSEEAAFTTVGSIALQGLRQADVKIGEKVVVIGLGLVGQLTVQLLTASGCLVIGSDLDNYRCSLAEKAGAAEAVTPSDLNQAVNKVTNGHGADTVIITASTKESGPINASAELCRLGGKVIVVGFIGMNIDHQLFYKKEIEVKMSMSYGPGRYDSTYEEKGIDYPYSFVRWTEGRNMDSFLTLIGRKKIDVKPYISKTYPLENSLEAYELLEKKESRDIGILISYPDNTQNADNTIVFYKNESAKSAKKEKNIYIGQIGAGNFTTSTLLPAIKKVKNISFLGLAASRGMSGDKTGKKYGFSYITTDVLKIINDPDINTVIITTRHNTHSELILNALNAGKHVFVEKPMCLTFKELKDIMQVLSGSNSRFLVGYNRRYSPYSVYLKDKVNHKGPLLINYRINAGILPSDHWFYDEEGGGRLLSEVVHFIDYCIFITGSKPATVYCTAVKPSENYKLQDNLSITINFSDGSVAAILYTALGDRSLPKEHIEVFGSRDVGIINDFAALKYYSKGKEKKIKYKGGQDKGHVKEMETFCNAIKDNSVTLIPVEDLYYGMITAFSALTSLKTGNEISIQNAIPMQEEK